MEMLKEEDVFSRLANKVAGREAAAGNRRQEMEGHHSPGEIIMKSCCW